MNDTVSTTNIEERVIGWDLGSPDGDCSCIIYEYNDCEKGEFYFINVEFSS